MNNVILIGRLVREPDLRYTSGSQMAVCRFTLAIDRRVKQGEEKKAAFPNVICFGKTAENCEKFLAKGRKVAVQGRLQTGSYEKDGVKHYTTDVIADNVEFLEWGEKNGESAKESRSEPVPEGFAALDEDIPF